MYFILSKYFRTLRANSLVSHNKDYDDLMSEGIHKDAFIEGLRIETAAKDPSYTYDGIPEILAKSKTVIRLFGVGITEDTLVTFTDVSAKRGTICDKIKSDEFPVSIRSSSLTPQLNSC